MVEKNRKSKKREAYGDAFKVKVIREYLDTGENISSLATRFNISVSALYSWLSNFGIETSPTNILSSMSKSNADLIKEVAELKRALEKSKLETWEAQVDALAHKKLLEHMENKYQISVKKRQILSDYRAKRQNIRGKVHWY